MSKQNQKTWNIDKPIAKITAGVSIVGTLAATYAMFYQGVNIPEAGYALIGGIVSGAGMFLFKDNGEK